MQRTLPLTLIHAQYKSYEMRKRNGQLSLVRDIPCGQGSIVILAFQE